MKIVSIVGMAGSGKSEVTGIFEDNGFLRVRFGDITDEELRNRGLELNEQNERLVREQLRFEHGMAAYAKLNLSKVNLLVKTSNVVIDGLYSWEEYTLLKEIYGDSFIVVAVWSSPRTRYQRLGGRSHRPLTIDEATARDKSEIENSNKGGPIAIADFTIINESSIKELGKETIRVLSEIK